MCNPRQTFHSVNMAPCTYAPLGTGNHEIVQMEKTKLSNPLFGAN